MNCIGDVSADIDGLEHGVGFILCIEDGYLHMLEGYTFEGPWPDRIITYSLNREKSFFDRTEFLDDEKETT
jgi:hypothetical protein